MLLLGCCDKGFECLSNAVLALHRQGMSGIGQAYESRDPGWLGGRAPHRQRG